MSVSQDLAAMGAPPKVMEAGWTIDLYNAKGNRPPTDLVEYIREWVGQHNTQDRYGQ